MPRPHLPISSLTLWSKLNDVTFLDVKVTELSGEGKGYGIITERKLSSKAVFDVPRLLVVPCELVLNAKFVEEFAKVDGRFRELVGGVGGKNTRRDIMLFLLMQITIASGEKHGVGLCNPWTEYVKMLPDSVPVPSLWTEPERVALVGTSLETAVNAKLAALTREFEEFCEKTNLIPWCQKLWWNNETIHVGDWALVDAWYRSRCLELPNSSKCMIPCIDMVNHSSEPTAYYEKTSTDGVGLLLRPDMELEMGSEVTISYGASKSDAEMLFSYGFIDERSTVQSLVLTLEPFPDDPLGKAKVAAFSKMPAVRITSKEGKVEWESPFLYLMCLNEEDGLLFRILQETDGSHSPLKVFWQGSDVTEATDTFEALINDHPQTDVFKLRAVALLHDRVREQLECLYKSEEMANTPEIQELAQPGRLKSALQLRKSETMLLEKTFAAIGTQKTDLLASEVVLQYLGSRAEDHATEDAAVPEGASKEEEEDFS